MGRSKYIRNNDTLVRLWCARQDVNRDCMIAMSGPKGNGKSNNALFYSFKCIRSHNKLLDSGDTRIKRVREGAQRLGWKWYRNLPYTGEEIKRCSDDREWLPNYSPVIVDEAIEAVYKRDAISRANKDIIKRFNKNRTRKLISFWNVPDFVDMDKDMRKLFNYHIWVVWRNNKYSLNLVFRRNTSGKDPWGMDYLKKIVKDVWEEMDEAEAWDIVKRVRKHPNLIGVVKVKPLSERLFAKYEEIRNEGVLRRDSSDDGLGVAEQGYKEKLEVVLYNARRVFAKQKGDLKKLHKVLCKHPDGSYCMTSTTFSSWTRKIEATEEEGK